MHIPQLIVDAFVSNTSGSGNPAAVALCWQPLNAAQCQAIAMQNALSETAFVTPISIPDNRFALRWFTPGAEVKLCGHATLATGAVLLQRLGFRERVQFETLSGTLSVAAIDSDTLAMELPEWYFEAASAPPDIVDCLGVNEIVAYGTAGDYQLVVLAAESAVAALKPDFRAMALAADHGVIVTAPGDQCDIVSRFFAPAIGVDEDPVTGSAHCALWSYWKHRFAQPQLHCRQLSARGGQLTMAQGSAPSRVRLEGRVSFFSQGFIHVR